MLITISAACVLLRWASTHLWRAFMFIITAGTLLTTLGAAIAWTLITLHVAIAVFSARHLTPWFWVAMLSLGAALWLWLVATSFRVCALSFRGALWLLTACFWIATFAIRAALWFRTATFRARWRVGFF